MYRRIVYPLLQHLDAERTHERVLRLLSLIDRAPLGRRLLARVATHDDPRLAVPLWNLRFANPLGIAAGLDKNAVAVRTWGALGWGHVEVGTVTPLPQPGNPAPRLFRLPPDRALINRMGFPGDGAILVRPRLVQVGHGNPVVGVNIGANKISVDAGRAAEDYLRAYQGLATVADYVTMNVSSPNTARLRELQGRDALEELVSQVVALRNAMGRRRPLLLKIAPDLTESEIDDIVEICLAHGIDGIVATNTTIARPDSLRSPARREAGGLSGAPLRSRSTEVIRQIARRTEGRLPIIGVGGVSSAADVVEKLAAGASLVQIYSGFVYEGPLLAQRICRDLSRLMDQRGLTSITELVGSDMSSSLAAV